MSLCFIISYTYVPSLYTNYTHLDLLMKKTLTPSRGILRFLLLNIILQLKTRIENYRIIFLILLFYLYSPHSKDYKLAHRTKFGRPEARQLKIEAYIFFWWVVTGIPDKSDRTTRKKY